MKKPLHTICALISMIWLSSSGNGGASAEASINARIESLVFNTSEAGYRFLIKLDQKDALELIEVEWEGQKFSFDKKDFGHVEDVFLRGVNLLAPSDIPGGRQDHVILVLPYKQGDEYQVDGKTIYPFDVARLQFSKGKLFMWERAESIEGKPGKWKLTSKGEITSHIVDGVDRVDANGVHNNGEHSSAENPYARFKIYEDSAR